MGPGSLWYLAFCRSATFLCGLLSSKQPQVLEGLHFQQTCIFKKVFFSLFFRESKDLKILKPRDAMTASWRPFTSGLYVPRRPKRNGIYTLFENHPKMSHFSFSKNDENWAFFGIFMNFCSECKRSSLRSQCWIRPFSVILKHCKLGF